MQIKKIVASAVAGAMMLATAGMASALEINLYGASAQFLFWSDAAKPFLEAQGCGTVTKYTKDSKNMIAKNADNSCIFRVSSKASFDGPLAVLGSTTDPNRNPECETSHGPKFRKMVDEATCSGSTCSSASKCVEVTIGASDVEGESFTQNSAGQVFGPLGGGHVTRAFNSIDTSSLANCRPLVVPFAFFVNTSVKKDGATITNVSRMQAVQIFSGQAWNWADFGASYDAQPIVACLRHAGSGTAATLDKTVMNPSWGGDLVTSENAGDPTVYFNDGSSDLTKCVAGSGAWTGTGAIGYADADQSETATMKRLTYNGVPASYETIINGEYDNFWSVQNLYYNGPNADVEALCAFAQDPARIPASKQPYWAAACEMTYMKAKDNNYPVYVGATCTR